MKMEFVATACLVFAIAHTFSVKWFQHLAHGFPRKSVAANLLHLFGEVEVVMGLWAGAFMVYLGFSAGARDGLHYVEKLNFTEPAFVFVVMTVASTRPVLWFAYRLVAAIARLLPLPRPVALYASTLTVGPLLGSLITEPAAMTLTAFILLERFFARKMSYRLMYATVGLLFVNVSIGGTLTSFAAPPVLMVAAKWEWSTLFMMTHFGWKGALACGLSTFFVTSLFYKELSALPRIERAPGRRIPLWIVGLHLLFLALIVASSHYLVVFMWVFLFFLGLVSVTREYQEELKLREGLLVAFFLAGIVVLAPPQRWWLEPLLAQMNSAALFFGSMGLTAITDNAALTYLGSQAPLTDPEKYALVAGSVVGGGLTVVANSPNPAGFGILNPAFGEEGISPIRLFLAALVPTAIAALCYWAL